MRIGSIKLFCVPWAAVAFLSALVYAPLAAQVAPSWALVATTGPPAVAGHAMAYDSQRGRTVVFGGVSPAAVFGVTWEWDGSAWALMATTGPTARYGHRMAYDSQRGRTVLFGGYDGPPSLIFNRDTWEWDGSTWTLMATTGPPGRISHAMAYDSQRGRTVLFGGDPITSDTWEWNGSTWTLMATTGPSARRTHAMAYDSHRGRTVLVGGMDNLLVYPGDTWEWDGSTWMQQAGSGPSTRDSPAVAYDSQRRRTVLFGGHVFNPSPPYSVAMSDTWEWDGSSWALVANQGPAARSGHAMAYDSQRGRTVMFGGVTPPAAVFGDTWEWTGGLLGTAATFGTGCGSPALVLSPIANARPVINTTAQAALTNIPSSLAFVAVGWSDSAFGPVPLPMSLAPNGMPGCDLLQSAEAAGISTASTGPATATFSGRLPNWSGLIGLRLYLQGWAVAPGVNPANVIVSNGLEWVIGSW